MPGLNPAPEIHPVRIGTAGWNLHRDSVAHFNAEGTHLQRYSAVLNACEINSSFYRPHKSQTWSRWADSVPQRFRFSVKAPKAITHEARLNCKPEVLVAFLQQLGHLREKLGPVLFQLPPSLSFDEVVARKFLTLLRENFSAAVVWEPRHPTWFDPAADDLLKEFKVARVAADPACVPAAVDPAGDGRLAYFRLHGSPRMYFSSYDLNFLNSLAQQLGQLRREKEVWCIFDNTGAGSALQNALQLLEKVEGGEGGK